MKSSSSDSAALCPAVTPGDLDSGTVAETVEAPHSYFSVVSECYFAWYLAFYKPLFCMFCWVLGVGKSGVRVNPISHILSWPETKVYIFQQLFIFIFVSLQETTHKASILLSGKLKVENGQIYQNPVTWLKDLLGGGSYVTWNYAWSKVIFKFNFIMK